MKRGGDVHFNAEPGGKELAWGNEGAGRGWIRRKLQVNELFAVGTLETQVQRVRYNTGMG